MKYEKITEPVIQAAIEVHRISGPGLLESTYEQCLAYELKQKGINFKLQHGLPVEYKGIKLDCGYRIDVFVEENLIIELKRVDTFSFIQERNNYDDSYYINEGNEKRNKQRCRTIS